MLAPQAQASTVSIQPVVTLTAPDHKTTIGFAAYQFDYRYVTVLAAIDHPKANTDYQVKVLVMHNGFNSFDAVTVCTIHATSTNRAACIAKVKAPTRHHNDTTVIAVSYGSPMRWAGWSEKI